MSEILKAINNTLTKHTEEYTLVRAEKATVDIVKSMLELLGKPEPIEVIVKVLTDYPVELPSSKIFLIHQLQYAWYYMLEHLGELNFYQLMVEFNAISKSILKNCHTVHRGDFVKIVDDITKYDTEAYSSIATVEYTFNVEIQNPIDRAIAYLEYIVKNSIFGDNSRVVALLWANKILIENKVGMLIVDSCELFNKFIGTYELYEDNSEFADFIKCKCIQKFN